jgi:hypothetical protein
MASPFGGWEWLGHYIHSVTFAAAHCSPFAYRAPAGLFRVYLVAGDLLPGINTDCELTAL